MRNLFFIFQYWAKYEGAILKRYYLEKHVLEIDSLVLNTNNDIDEKLKNVYCVRIKDESNLDNNIERMKLIHQKYKSGVKTKINPPHNFTKINCVYGWVPI